MRPTAAPQQGTDVGDTLTVTGCLDCLWRLDIAGLGGAYCFNPEASASDRRIGTITAAGTRPAWCPLQKAAQ